MRKFILLTSLSLFGIIGVYSGIWWYAAHCFKQSIAVMSEEVLTHEGISCSGFPFKLSASLKNPKIKTELGDISTQGTWIAGTTLLGTKGWFEVDGKTHLELLNDQLILNASGLVRCELSQPIKSFKFSQHFENFLKLETGIELLNNVSLYTQDLAIFDESQPLIKIDQLSCFSNPIDVAQPYSTGRSLDVDLKGFEIDGKNLESFLSRLIPSNLLMPGLDNSVKSGKQDMVLEAHFSTSPLDEQENLALCLDIKKLTYKDDLRNGDMKGRFTLNNNSSHYSGSVALDWESEYTKEMRNYAIDAAQATVQYYLNLIGGDHPKLENLFGNHWDEVATLIPDPSVEGIYKFQIDLDYTTHDLTGELSSPREMTCDLKNLYFKNNSTEMGLRGYFEIPQLNKPPIFEIRLSNHEQVLQRLANYYNQWRSLLISSETLSPLELPPINDRMVSRISRFLESLSQDQPNGLHIVVKGGKIDEVMIGSLNAVQFDAACNQLMADLSSEIEVISRPAAIGVE